jgi:hypothetical protein
MNLLVPSYDSFQKISEKWKSCAVQIADFINVERLTIANTPWKACTSDVREPDFLKGKYVSHEA